MDDNIPYKKVTIIIEDDEKIDTWTFPQVSNETWDSDWNTPESLGPYGMILSTWSTLSRLKFVFKPHKDETYQYGQMKRKNKDGERNS